MRRYFHTSNKEANLDEKRRSPARKPAHDLYFRRHNLQPPNEQESAPREYSRFADRSPEEVSKSLCAYKRESPKRSLCTRNLAGSSRNEQLYTRRSSLEDQMERENYSKSIEAKYRATESYKSNSVASDFLVELQALPTEIFLKIVLMKLDIMEVNGIGELSELARFINMCQKVFSKSLPPEIEEALKQMMSDEAESKSPSKSPSPLPELTGNKEEADMSLVSQILNLAKREPLSASSTVTSDQHALSTVTSDQHACSTVTSDQHASSTVTSDQHASSTMPSHQYASSTMPSHQYASSIVPPHQRASAIVPSHQYASSSISPYQNLQSYRGVRYGQVNIPHTSIYAPSPNESFAYNAASSNMTSAVPTLTLQEQRESYSAHNVYQSQFSHPSLPDRNNFRY